MSNNDFFSSFRVEKPELNVISSAGDHVVRPLSMRLTDADTKLDGSPKEKSRKWIDSHAQLAVTFGGKTGVLTNRFNSKGFIRYDELTTEQIASGKFTNADGYACITNKDGELVRCESVDRTTQCINILNKFAFALGIAEGEDLVEAITRAIAEKSELVISVKREVYEGKDQYVVNGFKKVADVKTADDDEYSA